MPIEWRELATSVVPTAQGARRRAAVCQPMVSSEADSSRPLLGNFAAGDLARYAVIEDYLHTICSPEMRVSATDMPAAPGSSYTEITWSQRRTTGWIQRRTTLAPRSVCWTKKWTGLMPGNRRTSGTNWTTQRQRWTWPSNRPRWSCHQGSSAVPVCGKVKQRGHF